MPCCGGNNSEDETADRVVGEKLKEGQQENSTFVWHPTLKNAQKIAYVRQLEKRYERLQSAYFNLSAELARLQACLRQIVRADARERGKLIDEVRSQLLKNVDCCVFPSLEQHNIEMGSLHRKQHLLMATLRQQIGSFQEASENLDNKRELVADGKESQNSLISEQSSKTATTCCQFSKVKETPSVKVTKYADTPPPAASATKANAKPEKSKKLGKFRNKLKTNPKSTAKMAKTEDGQKMMDKLANSSQLDLSKKTADTTANEKSKPANRAFASPSYKKVLSAETLSSGGQSIISTRSASFKELREKYQHNPGAAK